MNISRDILEQLPSNFDSGTNCKFPLFVIKKIEFLLFIIDVEDNSSLFASNSTSYVSVHVFRSFLVNANSSEVHNLFDLCFC